MAARGFPIGGTVREAIGFAGAHYEDALRLCWLPVLLTACWMGFAPTAREMWPGDSPVGAVLDGAVLLALSAMYLGPLLRLAARGEAPDHGTAPLRLGWSPVRYAVGSVLSLGGTILLTAPIVLGARGLVGGAEGMRRAEVAVFEEGSLHAVEFVPAFDASRIDAAQGLAFLLLALVAALLWGWTRSWLWTLGLTALFLAGQFVATPLLAQDAPAWLPPSLTLYLASAALIGAYVSLRLTPLPWFWAARRREDAWPVLRSALRTSAGASRFRLIGVLALFGLFNVLLGYLLIFVPATFGLGLAGADALLSGTTALTNGGETAGWVPKAMGGARLAFGYAFTVATTALGAALTAGLGGALVARTTA